MAEYIEREAVYDFFSSKQQELLKFHRYCQLEREDKEEFDRYDSYLDEIEAIPTVDVIKVVRCGECEHFHEYPDRETNCPSGWGKCKKIYMDIDLTINDFCSYAEKKEGAEK